MRPRRSRPWTLLAVAGVLAVAVAAVYWPSRGSGVDGAKLLSADELRALPADASGDRLLGLHIGCLVYGHGGAGSYAALPPAALHAWATLSFEAQASAGLQRYLQMRAGFVEGPSLAVVASAYEAIALGDAAKAVRELERIAPAPRPGQLEALATRLAAAQAGAAAARRAYVAEHAEELAARR